MHKILYCAAALAMLPTAAVADPFESEKFNWDWQGQLNVGGLKIPQSGNVCLSKEMTREHLSEAFRSYDESCEVLGWNPQGETTYFALSCRGDQTTDLAGELTVAKDVAELKLKGNVRLANKSELPTNGAISANWTGDCLVPETLEAVAEETVEMAAVVEVVEEETLEMVAVAEVAEPDIEPAVMVEESDAAELTEVALEADALPPVAEPVDIPDAPVVEAMPVIDET